MLLLAAVLAVALSAGAQSAPATSALWTPGLPRLPGVQQVEQRRTVSRCMTNLAELTGFNGEARDSKWVQPGMWGSTHAAPRPLTLVLTLDPIRADGLPRPTAHLSQHVLNLPPPLA